MNKSELMFADWNHFMVLICSGSHSVSELHKVKFIIKMSLMGFWNIKLKSVSEIMCQILWAAEHMRCKLQISVGDKYSCDFTLLCCNAAFSAVWRTTFPSVNVWRRCWGWKWWTVTVLNSVVLWVCHYPAVVSSDICLPQPLWMTLPSLKCELITFSFLFLFSFCRWAKVLIFCFLFWGVFLLLLFIVFCFPFAGLMVKELYIFSVTFAAV